MIVKIVPCTGSLASAMANTRLAVPALRFIAPVCSSWSYSPGVSPVSLEAQVVRAGARESDTSEVGQLPGNGTRARLDPPAAGADRDRNGVAARTNLA